MYNFLENSQSNMIIEMLNLKRSMFSKKNASEIVFQIYGLNSLQNVGGGRVKKTRASSLEGRIR